MTSKLTLSTTSTSTTTTTTTSTSTTPSTLTSISPTATTSTTTTTSTTPLTLTSISPSTLSSTSTFSRKPSSLDSMCFARGIFWPHFQKDWNSYLEELVTFEPRPGIRACFYWRPESFPLICMSLSLSHFPLFLMSLSLSLQGVFLLTTKNAFLLVKRVFSVNRHIQDFQPCHKGVSEVSERACEWGERAKQT